jgi:CMP-N-acetylneuraminic acid synthetase
MPLNGLPLPHYALNALLATPSIDRVCVFCSDPSIREHVPAGVEVVLRPASLDTNTTLGIDIYQSFLSKVESEYYLLSHVTSPFLRSETLERAAQAVLSGAHDSALTVRPVQTFCWYRGKPLNYELTHVKRTQDLEPVYAETSACFLFPRQLMLDEGRRVGDRPYFMVTDFPESIDIDTYSDFLHAEVYLGAQKQHSAKARG